ncbi:MAG TPA: hypothetical protein VIX15_16315 [Streptosporangiaceae bacterium]
MLTIGAFAAAPAQAGGGGGDEGQLIPVFIVGPTTTQVNTAVTPTVEVKVEHGNGQQDWDYNGPVVLKYAVNRLGAPLPTGNEVNADDGIAKFPALTFSTVGFGFELEAVIPGQPEGQQQPWPWPSGGPGWAGWVPGQGPETSVPSAPFDIVGQLMQCAAEETCQSQTVSSDGTSGSSVANTQASGTLSATGGGFPSLSCTRAGGVVSFFSNLPQTIKVTGSLGKHPWSWWFWHKKSVSVCFGSTQPFTTKSGAPAVFNTANGDYEGLLPFCGAYRPAPCVSSVRFGPWGSVTSTIQAPAGDPHMTY